MLVFKLSLFIENFTEKENVIEYGTSSIWNDKPSKGIIYETSLAKVMLQPVLSLLEIR